MPLDSRWWQHVTAGVLAVIVAVRFAPPARAQGPGFDYSSIIDSNVRYIEQHQLADGAIKDNTSYIMPYFANFAALALARSTHKGTQTRAWMRWYVSHLNEMDVWGGTGSVYDYDASSETGRSRESADSIDSYGATFLSVARAAWDDDTESRAYIREIEPQLLQVFQSVEAQREPNGLTWSKPTTRVAYLEDNCEVYRGLSDFVEVERRLGHLAVAKAIARSAARTRAAIEERLWQERDARYADFIDAKGKVVGVKPAVWKSAVSELFPILYGVIPSDGARAHAIYARFNDEYPRWPNLEKPDPFPWALVADVAEIMGDDRRAVTFIRSAQETYEARGFRWPWHVQEAAFMVIVTLRLAAGPATPHSRNTFFP